MKHRKKTAKEMGGSLLSSRFATGNTEFEVVKQYSFQLAAALWRQKQLQLKHPATLALCRLAFAVASNRTFLLSPLPAAFQPPAATFSFLLLYIFFLISPESCLHFLKGRWNWIFFQARFSKEASFMWSVRTITFFTSPYLRQGKWCERL